METQLDMALVETSSLRDRWERVNSRPAFSARCQALGIKTFKHGSNLRKTYLHAYQVAMLDDLDNFLMTTNGTLKEYSADWKEKYKITEELPELPPPITTTILEPAENQYPLEESLILAVGQILSRLPSPAFLEYQQLEAENKKLDLVRERLENFATKQWWGTGSELAHLLNIKKIPRNGYKAYGFQFFKISKRSKWWKVVKIG